MTDRVAIGWDDKGREVTRIPFDEPFYVRGEMDSRFAIQSLIEPYRKLTRAKRTRMPYSTGLRKPGMRAVYELVAFLLTVAATITLGRGSLVRAAQTDIRSAYVDAELPVSRSSRPSHPPRD